MPVTDHRDVHGRLQLERAAGFGFPWAKLVGSNGAVAALGRFGAINVFLLRGQRIVLADGQSWRLKGVSWHRFVCPTLLDAEGRKLATSTPGHGNYAITCRARAFMLIPAEKRSGRPRRWELVEFGEPVAQVRRNPYEAEIAVPIPLPALVMSFGLGALGVMGEKDLVPTSPTWA